LFCNYHSVFYGEAKNISIFGVAAGSVGFGDSLIRTALLLVRDENSFSGGRHGGKKKNELVISGKYVLCWR